MPRELRPIALETTKQGPEDQAEHREFQVYGQASVGEQRQDTLVELHPYTQVLSTADVDSCVLLENAAFPPQERCSRDKFEYRFSVCGELSLGLFSSTEDTAFSTSAGAQAVETQTPARRAVLLAHIIATKSVGSTVTDDDMALPDPSQPDPTLGHKEEGRTVCIHSLAVLPSHQRKGLGVILMKAYLDRIKSSGVADMVAIIAHDHLIKYYERLGFSLLGPSQAQFGGGGWYDMVLVL